MSELNQPRRRNSGLAAGVAIGALSIAAALATGAKPPVPPTVSSLSPPDVSAAGPTQAPCPVEAIRIAPDRSIQAAVDRAGVGSAFCIGAGRHRAETVAPKDGQRFFGEPGAVMDGAVEVTEFRPDRAAWIGAEHLFAVTPIGGCRPEFPACLLPEAAWLDGQPLTRVLARGELGPGRFFIDADRRLVVADDPKRHRVEVSTTPFAFLSNGARDVTVANLIVERYANPAQRGAIYNQHNLRASGWLITHNTVRLNSGLGILAGSGARVIANRVERNGQLGISASLAGGLIEGNEIDGNNTRGYNPAWEAGGLKAAVTTGLVLRGNDVHHNHGPGLWCDIECRDTLYEGNRVAYNDGPGLFHEISYKAIVRHNIAAFNGAKDSTWYWGANILLAASQDVTVEDNEVMVAEGGTGIAMIDQGRPREKGGLYRTAGNLIRHNTTWFEGVAPVRMGGISDVAPGSPNDGVIESGGNRFEDNRYVAARARVDVAWGRSSSDFEGFQALGQDRGSMMLHE